MFTVRTPERHCPTCNYVLDAVSNLDGSEAPEIGDFSICIGCAEILRFGPSMTLYKPSGDELKALLKADLASLMKARLAVTMYLRRTKNEHPGQ